MGKLRTDDTAYECHCVAEWQVSGAGYIVQYTRDVWVRELFWMGKGYFSRLLLLSSSSLPFFFPVKRFRIARP